MSRNTSAPEGLFIPVRPDAQSFAGYPVLPESTGSEYLLFCDDGLRVTWANSGARELFPPGRGVEDGLTGHEVVCPRAAGCPACDLQEVLDTGVARTWETKTEAGRILSVGAYPAYRGSEDPAGLLVIASDVTDQRHAQAELERSTDTIRSLFAAVPVGVGVATDRVLTHVNEKLQEMTGYSRRELIGSSVRMLYESDEEYRRVGDYKYRMLRRQGVCNLETQFLTKDGEVLDVFMRSAALDPHNIEAGVIFTALDITERKQTQQALERAVEQKDTLLREVHHRSKNNMQIISSLLNLESERAGRVEVSEPLQKMRARIRSMALVHEKLYQSDDLQRVDLAEYVEKLSAEVVSLHGGALERTVEAESVAVDIDFAVPFGLIVNELLTNALQHGFDAADRGAVSISVWRDGEIVHLRIRDDGKGVPEDFDLRSTRSLGLQLVSALADQLHGSVDVHADGGTVWDIELMDHHYLRSR